MTLPTKVDSQEAIPEGAENFYVEKNGAWELDADFSGFTGTLQKERAARRQLESQVAELKKSAADSATENPDDAGRKRDSQVDGNDVITSLRRQQEQMSRDMEAMKAAQAKTTESLRQQLYTERVTKQALAHAGALQDNAQEDFEAAIQRMFHMEGDKQIARDREGNPLFDEQGNPLSLAGGVKLLKKQKPYLFKQPVGTGAAGAAGIAARPGAASANGKKVVEWTQENFSKYRDEIAAGKVVMAKR